jgi:hypothetical protein
MQPDALVPLANTIELLTDLKGWIADQAIGPDW